MAAALSFLAEAQVMHIGDYITSPAELFFATLQEDGNFCIYYGSDPQNVVGTTGLWCASSAGLMPDVKQGPYYAILQADGNFCIYYGSDPDHKTRDTPLWCASSVGLMPDASKGPYYAKLYNSGDFCVIPTSGNIPLWCVSQAPQAKFQLDPIANIEIDHITYDTKQGIITPQSSLELYSQRAINTTTTTQSTIISGSSPTPDDSSWYNKQFTTVPSQTTFKTNIPFISNGKIETSVELVATFDWSAVVDHPNIWSYNVPVVVPPNMSILATISVQISHLSVPFNLLAFVTFRSGRKVSMAISGQYRGQAVHDLSVSFRPLSQKEILASEQESLTATVDVSDLSIEDRSILPQIAVNIV